jgi:hypothetical protein
VVTFQAAHRPQPGLQAPLVSLDRIIRVLPYAIVLHYRSPGHPETQRAIRSPPSTPPLAFRTGHVETACGIPELGTGPDQAFSQLTRIRGVHGYAVPLENRILALTWVFPILRRLARTR